MGICGFFYWLTKRCPQLVSQCIEKKPIIVNGVKIDVDISQKNPNDVEFDNLYLDINGIIHLCCHPENKPAPKDEEEMTIAIFRYIDRIFAIVRPRRLLYIATDGVAPKAKMNQQRSRRFRSAKESAEKAERSSRAKGVDLPLEKVTEHFDSNCITPGTLFMTRLANCLHYYIHNRLNSDPGWRTLEVIFSDANVPGEGEQKIMDFIRRQRCHNVNTRHCVYGADADLILLGLATHEKEFFIIREKFEKKKKKLCELCGHFGHKRNECTEAAKEKQTNRVIDDWVFMCLFVGNDFLPHLPSLEMREGSIDELIRIYKKTVYSGYITDHGHINLNRLQHFMINLAGIENEILKRRQEFEGCSFLPFSSNLQAFLDSFSLTSISSISSPVQNARHEAYQMRMYTTSPSTSGNQSSTKEHLESMLKPDEGNSNSQSGTTNIIHSDTPTNKPVGSKRKRDYEEDDSESEPEPEDDVRLLGDLWKERYYEEKFAVKKDDIQFRHKVAAAYVEGLCWVLRYFYEGCASWNWYFPYHYAPFASDFVNIGDLKINFEKGKPFKPLEQLMAVFPAASKQHVPEPWGELMYDPESPIIDFYPTDFKIDLNGKKYTWQGVALLPFVDERRLLKALESVYPKLTTEEIKRNVQSNDRLYVRQGHKGYEFLVTLYETGSNWKLEIDVNPKLFSGMSGTVILSEDVIHPKDILASPVKSLPDLPENAVVCIHFKYPEDS